MRVLAALAHPVRVGLLNHLLGLGPATATECAASVGVSPSACSYHLRQLERFGLVERVPVEEGDDGRTRPWQARHTGYSIGPIAVRSDRLRRRAAYSVIASGVERNTRLAEQYLQGAGSLPDEWQEAAEFSSYGITVTADELVELTHAIDRLVRPYLTPTRGEPPAEAEPVHVVVQAFRHLAP